MALSPLLACISWPRPMFVKQVVYVAPDGNAPRQEWARTSKPKGTEGMWYWVGFWSCSKLALAMLIILAKNFVKDQNLWTARNKVISFSLYQLRFTGCMKNKWHFVFKKE